MAFNLDKNDGSNSSSASGTTQSTKFNLAKNDSNGDVKANDSKKSKAWLFVVIGALLLLGIWFFNSNDNASPETEQGTTQAANNGELRNTSPENATSMPAQNTVTTPQASPEGNDMASNSNNAKDRVANNELNSGGNSQVVSKEAKDNRDNKSQSIAQTSNSDEKKPVSNSRTASNTRNKVSNGNDKLNNKVPASFAKASSSLEHIDNNVVSQIVDYLAKNPKSSLNVYGYASSEGDASVNQSLSQKRAEAFSAFLISKGVDASRIHSSGRGVENPIASNDNEKGRMKNRRVEIVFE